MFMLTLGTTYCVFSFPNQWQKKAEVSVIYLVYRWAFGILFLGVWIWSIISAAKQNTPVENYLSKWPIYLTNWGYTLCTIQALLAAGLITQQIVKERRSGAYYRNSWECMGFCNKRHDSVASSYILDLNILIYRVPYFTALT
jgi:hypothetical protein